MQGPEKQENEGIGKELGPGVRGGVPTEATFKLRSEEFCPASHTPLYFHNYYAMHFQGDLLFSNLLLSTELLEVLERDIKRFF